MSVHIHYINTCTVNLLTVNWTEISGFRLRGATDNNKMRICTAQNKMSPDALVQARKQAHS